MDKERRTQWLRRLKDKFKNRGSEGFSLIEMVTIIPVVAITGGFIIILIAQGIQSSAESAAISSAGMAVSARATELRSSYNCYDLNQKAKENNYIKIYKQPAGRKDIAVKTNVSNCSAGSNAEVSIAGRENGNNRILYSETIEIFISE